MLVRSLHDSVWMLSAVGDRAAVPATLRDSLSNVPAFVPGCVHTDLMAAGIIEDPNLADNELRQYWIGRVDWAYSTTFEISSDDLKYEKLELACDGLDTIATIELNGQRIGSAQNMHASYRFDLRAAAKVGSNELKITFAAPMTYAEGQRETYPGLPVMGGPQKVINPHNMMRKMSCNMGWDWGLEVTTAGIWKDIRIEAWNTARIDYVRPLVHRADASLATVDVHVDLTKTSIGKPFSIAIRLTAPSGEVVHDRTTTNATSKIDVHQPQLWWPIGYGAQPRYKLEVKLIDAAGKVLDTWQRKIGLRTTSLDTTPDAAPVGAPIPNARGERMTLRVNGQAIYCKGANWIPLDTFPQRVTTAQYRQRIEQAVWANMNILRVWGGGIFEDDRFFEICDELGVMVWHDFLFACACYPEEEPYWSNVELEARQNVARLSCHPSLVIWNGCNEIIMGVFDWGPAWEAMRLQTEKTWGLGYFMKLLPEVIADLDPSRPYWPASPYSGSMDRKPNAHEYGNVHIWDVWHGAGQYRNYLAYYPRMATEFGYHGPASYATIARAIPPEQREWNSPMMELHNKNQNPGQLQTNMRMADDFVPPTGEFDHWHYLAQVMQARALSMGIEWFRALYPWNSGAVYWQFNDCYPVSSWSAIDSDGRPKPLLYASRHFFAPRLCTIKPRHVTPSTEAIGALAVYFHNDHAEAWKTTCVLREMSLDGHVLAEVIHPINVGPRGALKIDLPESMCEREDSFLVAITDESKGLWWFLPDKQLNYPRPDFDAQLINTADGQRLTISARSLMRDLCFFPDRLDANATISENFVTLLPGDQCTFIVRGQRRFELEELTSRPVMNCANYFGADTSRTNRSALASAVSAT